MNAPDKKISRAALAGASMSSKHNQIQIDTCKFNRTLSSAFDPIAAATGLEATISQRVAGMTTKYATIRLKVSAPPLVNPETKVE
jgi:hypothetical protein